MLIRSLNVGKYGVCQNTEINDINDDLLVVYGPNEAGKTTCMEFIRGVFYGLANDGREKYVCGDAGETYGGSVAIESGDGQSWTVTRQLATADGQRKEKLDILIGGQLHSSATMNRELLKGVDHDIFRNVFTVGLDELQHLNTLNATEAAEFLYEMTTGMDRVSLGEVMHGVTQTRHSIFDRNHEGSEIRQLKLRVEQLDQLIHGELRQVESWSQLRNELHAGKQDIQRITEQSHTIQRNKKLFEIATLTHERWINRNEAIKELEELPHLSESLAEIVNSKSVQQLHEIDAELVTLNEEIQELTVEVSAVKRDIRAIPINTDVASNAVRIRAICEHSSWLASLQDQIASLKKGVVELSNQGDFELSSGLLDRIVGPMPEVDHHTLRAVNQVETELIFADERYEEQSLLVDQIQGDLREVEQSWMDAVLANAPQLIVVSDQNEAHSAIDDLGFEQMLTDMGSDIGALRTRLELDDQQMRLQREIEAEENQIAIRSGRLLPSGNVLMVSAGLTISGFVGIVVGVLFAEVFFLDAAVATLIGILGAVAFACGISYRMLKSLHMKQQASAGIARHSLLSRQQTKCYADINALEINNDRGGGSWDVQLRDLGAQHSQLESMVPLLGKLKTASARLKLSRTRLADCQRNSDEAQKAWASVLVEQGLPRGLQPCDIHAISANSDVIAQRKRRLDDRKAELVRRESDLADLVNRIEQLLIELDIQPESSNAAVQIQQLNRLLNSQREAKQQRKALKKSARKLKKQRNRIIAKRQDLETSLNRVFVRAGVSDLAELELLSQSHCVALELKSRSDEASELILQQLKDQDFDEHDLYEVLDKHNVPDLMAEIARMGVQLDESTDALAQLHELQGQKKQELQQLLKDHTLDSAKLERNVVQQQLADAQRRWRVWAVSEYVLQQVRDVYESERQPETLVDAGQWLGKISDGKYIRIWTPLDEDALYVDDSNGQTWGVDMLSRGTRESVFICLRLALVNSYIKRGIRLPLILDDVLVNCDSTRAKHGVSMLRDFAGQGTQVFFFTCHSHLASDFESAAADVRELTLRDNVIAPDIQRISNTSTNNLDDIGADAQLFSSTNTDQNIVVNDTEVEAVIPESRDVRDPPEQHVDEEIALVQNLLPDEELGTHLTKEDDADAIVTEYHDSGVIDDDKLLSTEQEIAVVDRLVEAVAGEIDQLEPRAESISQTEERAPANMDIGELVERAIEESRYEADEEKYDEIEIIEDDDYEMKTLDGNDSDAEIADWQGEVWDQDDIDEEDDLAA
jgi:uncharacterized protein YhaN